MPSNEICFPLPCLVASFFLPDSFLWFTHVLEQYSYKSRVAKLTKGDLVFITCSQANPAVKGYSRKAPIIHWAIYTETVVT